MEQQILEATEHFVSPEERVRLVHLCAKITGDRDAAEDLAQETLLEAWKHLNVLRDQSRRVQWLNGVARNVCLRWMRSHQKDRAQLLAPPSDQDASPDRLEDFLADDFDVEVELEHKELVELLDRALALLPAETRTILVKRYVEESPLQEVADQLGLNVSAAAMRLQRGKLALRRVLTTDLRQEIAPYSISSTLDQWEETPFWCHLCGQHRLLGIRRPENGQLLFKCPACSPGTHRILSYNELPLLKGVKGYRSLFTRLRDWCGHYYWSGLQHGSVPCEGCGRILPVHIGKSEDLPDWVRSNYYENMWTGVDPNRVVAIFCEHCHGSYKTVLEYLVLDLPEGRQFLQAHPRIRTLPNQEVEAEGRPAIVTRHTSLSDNATFTVVSDYETYRVLRIDGGAR